MIAGITESDRHVLKNHMNKDFITVSAIFLGKVIRPLADGLGLLLKSLP